jgi:hypothetical protein
MFGTVGGSTGCPSASHCAPNRALRRRRQDEDMVDDQSKTRSTDRERLNPSVDYEVRNWARRYGVSEDRLREAVTKAGPVVGNVALQAGKLP